MKTKRLAKVSARLLVALLVVVMVFTVAASTAVNQVTAESAPVFWKNNSIHTNYEQFLDGSVVQRLPDTVKSDDEISVIVKLDMPTLMEMYNATDKTMSFGEYVNTDEALKMKESIKKEKEAYAKALASSSIPYTFGAEYSNLLAGFEVIFEARHFYDACDNLNAGATAIVSEVYNVSETQLVNNNVVVDEYTGIFDTSKFEINGQLYSGSGMVVAVLDTGLDYTHPAFDPQRLNKSNLTLTKNKVADVISNTTAATRVPGLTADDVYINEKVPFAFDYADNDSDVYSLHNNHGTHVSGVIVGHDDEIRGAAPDAQLVSMKIFSDVQDSARASWILAALEDCVELGVDVINMSLGTACGFSRETDQEQMSGVYDDIRALGISLVVAASNSFNSAYGSEKNGNLGLTSNPDTSTVGSPSTYKGALSIASIDGTKTPYLLDQNGTIIYFVESSDAAGEQRYFFDGLLGTSTEQLTLEYILVPGVGNLSDYEGIDVNGKIALVRRGSNTFEEKAKAAKAAGARALIVYNNTSGDIRMNVGIVDIPVCSVSQDDGEMLAARKTGTLVLKSNQKSGPFMSDFSSWGPSPSLEIKPEITAHGGNILSAVTGHGYDRLSGTSMACPNMAGVIALMRQYVKVNFEERITKTRADGTTYIDNVELNAIVNRLFMSTADIVNNKNGLPYAVRKQGAGLASLTDAALTKAYILTYDRLDGSVMDKTKIELGDDPNKTGVYTLKFTIDNFGNSALSYDISASVMTEGVSDTPTYQGDRVVTEEGYMLSGASIVIQSVSGGTQNGNTVTVNGNSKCDVTVTITLSDSDKKYLDDSFENGMYVEGFVKLTAKDSGSTDLNVPYLAFYGDWYRAPLFDLDYFETNADELNDAIDTLDKTLPDAYATRPIGGISEDYVSYLGSYYFTQNPANKIIAANRDYIALSNTEGTVHSLRFVWGGLLRNADRIVITITDDATGEIVFQKTEESIRKSYSDGGSYIYPANIKIEWDAAEQNLKNNSKYTVKLQGYLNYDDGTGINKTPEYNLNSTFEFPLTIDYEAPTLTGCNFYTEYDNDAKKTRLFVEMAVYDNHYSMGMQIGYIDYLKDLNGNIVIDPSTNAATLTMNSFENYVVPIYSERNGTTYVTYELTDHIYKIKEKSFKPNSIVVAMYDYAMNEATYEINLPAEFTDFYLENTEITLNPNEVYTLSANVYPEKSWDELLTFASTDENVVRVVNNKIVAVNPGKCKVTFKDKTTNKMLSMDVTVRAPGDNGYAVIAKPVADVFDLTGFYTVKAFYFMSNDERDIGEEDTVTMFSNQNYSLSMFPSEKVQLQYKLDAFFPENTTVEFISNNEDVVKVSADGTVEAFKDGFTSITVRVVVDGKPTFTAKTVNVEVKDPYVRTGPTLNNYFGAGEFNAGVVEIPKDKLFTQIGQYAFSNFKYVPKDLSAGDVINEEEPDATKMTYIGNDCITEVIIPEGVKTIGAYAFAGLTALKKVTLPSTLEAIEYGAFFGCISLETVEGLEHVKLINQNAFAYCNIDGSLSLDSIHAIGDYAFFENRNLDSISFPSTLSSIGAYAFAFNEYSEEQKQALIKQGFNVGDPELKVFDVSRSGKVKYGPYLFMNNTTIESLTLDTAVIPTGAFYNCSSLTDVYMSANVSYIGEYAFTKTNVSTFKFTENNPNYRLSVSEKYLLSPDGKTLILVAPQYSGSFVQYDVTKIGCGAFAGNNKIASIDMPSVTYVDDYAFAECKNLTSVRLGNLTNIGKYAYFLTSITEHPDFSNVSYIGDYAFGFTMLKEVTVGDDKTIGEGAFCEIVPLEKVIIGNNVTIGNTAFLRGTNTVDPRNPGKNLNATLVQDANGYYRIDYTSNLTTLVIGENAKIGASAFYGASALLTATLGDGAVIGEMAFYNCRSLGKIDLSGVLKIGKMAFCGDNDYVYESQYSDSPMLGADGQYIIVYYNPIISSIDLSSLVELSDQAFMYCTELKEVKFGKNLDSIPYMAFANCPKLTTVIGLENIRNIGYGAFAETGIKADNLDLSGVEVIGDYAFIYCEGIKGVTLNANASVVGEGAFSYASKLSTVINLDKVTNVGAYAFAYTNITEADLSGAVSIGDYAFLKLELTDFKLTLSESIASLGDNPFAMCRLVPFSREQNIEWNGNVVGKETVYTFDISETVKVIDGSLYCVVPKGIELITFIGRAEILDNVVIDKDTVRISGMAFAGSDVVRVELPHSLNSIGHKAFFDCKDLSLVVFKSYEAPILEEEFDKSYYESYDNLPATGSYEFSLWVLDEETGNLVQTTISKDGLGIVPYYMWNVTDGRYSNAYYGANFVGHIGHANCKPDCPYASHPNMGRLVMVAPSNGEYYDSFIYGQYFLAVVDGAVAADDNTMAAIEAINKIPDSSLNLKEHESIVIAARAAYNKISSPEQQALIADLYQKLVSAENLIAVLKGSDDTAEEETVILSDEEPKDVGKIVLIISVITEGAILLALVTIHYIYPAIRKRRAASRIKKSTAKMQAIAGMKNKVSEEITPTEMMSYEKMNEGNANQEKIRIAKKVLIYALIGGAILISILLLSSRCSKDTSPYPEYAKAGYNVSVKYDANGGVFTTNTETIVDTYKLDTLPDGSEGFKQITLLDPNDPIRGNQAYSASRVGYYLAGWYYYDSNNDIHRWDFGSSKYEIPKDATYNNENPVLTLYAMWVPAFTYEFYSVDENGNTTLIGSKGVDPTVNAPITVPYFDSATGGINAGDFPKLENRTYSGIYLDQFCTIPVTGNTLTHTGSFYPSNATVRDEVMKIYCKTLEGMHFTINSAEQLINSAMSNGVYTLESDIDFTGYDWPEIFTSGVSGTSDESNESSGFNIKIIGNGHTIKNVTLDQKDAADNFGLFATLSSGSLIKDVTFDNITVNIHAGAKINSPDPQFGIIVGHAADGIFDGAKLTNSKLVIYTNKTSSITILKPEYGIVCGYGSVSGIDFSTGNTVEFSRFGDSEGMEQTEYNYNVDEYGRFKLAAK